RSTSQSRTAGGLSFRCADDADGREEDPTTLDCLQPGGGAISGAIRGAPGDTDSGSGLKKRD
ncbi:hypothetical protein THAOC_07783, partial [Thalassiosira oceanica]